MESVNIPFTADTTGIRAATAEMASSMRQFSSTMMAAMATLRSNTLGLSSSMRTVGTAGQAAARSIVAVGTGARGSMASVGSMIQKIGNAGATVANVVAGVQAMRTAWRGVSSFMANGGPAAVMARLRTMINGIGSGLRAIMANPALRTVAIAAGAAAVAVGSVVAAVKLGKVAFAAIGNAGRSAFHGLATAARGFANMARSVFASVGSAIRGMREKMSGAAGSFKTGIGVTGILGPLAGLAGAAGAIALIATQIKGGLSLAGELERTGIALEALTGSSSAAKSMLEEMRQTWVRTGVSVAEQAGTIQKFLALGFSQADASKLQKNILDVAGAVGMSTSEAELLGSALAQVKAKGVVSMEELRQQIAEKGVPVFEALAAKLGVTQGALMKLVGDGQVPAKALLDLFLNMEGAFGRFQGGAARMGSSFLGLLSRLRGAWSLIQEAFARPLADALKPVISGALNLVQQLRPKAEAAGKAVGEAMLGVFALVQSGRTFEVIRAGFQVAFTGATDTLMRGLRSAVAFLATALPPIFNAAVAKLRDPYFIAGVKALFYSVGAELSAALADAVGNVKKGTALRKISDQTGSLAADNFEKSVRNTDFGAVISAAIIDATKAAKEEAGGPRSDSFQAALANLRGLLASVSDQVASLRSGTAIPAPTAASSAPGAVATAAATASKVTGLGAVVSSLARVGGAALPQLAVASLARLTEKGNRLREQGNATLKRIENALKNPGAPESAVYV